MGDRLVITRNEQRPHLRGTYTIEPAPAEAFAINDDVGPLASLTTFDIRNGPLSAAKSLLVKPTIGSAWHWRPVAELPPDQSVKHVNAFIRTYACALSTLPAGAYPADLKRKLALVMGVARAVCTELYNIEVQDLIPGEAAPAFLKTHVAQGGEYRFMPVDGLTAEQRTILGRNLDITEEEKAAISSIHMSAIGVLPVQGYSLIMTNHHYLSDKGTQSFRAFNVLEKHHWNAASVKPWWDAHLDALRDALFHKVGHPVLINIKQTMAMNPDMVEKLKAAGCGSAASRLPALESEVRAANSYRTLCQTVRTLFESYGGYLNFVALDQAIECVNQSPPGVADTIKEGDHPMTVPTWVKDRPTALSYLRQVLDGHTDIVAYCYGFYVALSDAAQSASGTMTDDTLRTSYSLSKLAKQSTASYTAGREAFGDYAAHKRAMRAEAKYNPPLFTFVGGRPLPEGTVPLGVGVQNIAPTYTPQ